MAMFNIVKAKRDGYTDAEIAEYLASQSGFNYAKAKQDGYEDKEIVSYLNKQDLSFGQAFLAGAKAEVGSEIRGARQLAGGELTEEEVARESIARQAEEERGVATTLGRIAGGLVNPSSLIPGSVILKGVKGVALGGAVAGGVSGAVDPVFVEGEDPSRLTKAAIGVVGGGVLGGVVGAGAEALQRRFGRTIDDVAKVEPDATADAPKTREQIEAELAPLTPADNTLPALLAKAPEADQKYVESILSRYDLDEEVPYPVIKELSDKVEDEELAALFKGMSGPPPDKIIDDFVPESKLPETVAKVEPDEGVAKSTGLEDVLQRAEATGDYRDYLAKSTVRLAQLSPVQFKKILDPENPFAQTNFKVLISKRDDVNEYMQRMQEAAQGRFKYERDKGVTWQELAARGEEIPDQVVLNAILGRRKGELLPAPVLIKGIKLADQAIKDLNNLTELHKAAKDMGSEEAYTVLHNELHKAFSVLMSLEGNRSEMGIAFNSFKLQQKLLDQNKTLRAFTGGVSC